MTDKNKEIFVFARNNVEMQTAQTQLIEWAESRIIKEVEERDDLQRNMDLAVKAGWDTRSLDRALRRSKKRIAYYDKIKAALQAGYQIVPNMDVEVFAVRTEAKNPRKNKIRSNWMVPADQATSYPQKGEGRYVSPSAQFDEVKDIPDQSKLRWATDFRDVDFPFALAKVQVLDTTNRAMALKVFDDMGVLPRQQRNADPMVIGRVGYKHGHEERWCSFVVAWFLNTEDL